MAPKAERASVDEIEARALLDADTEPVEQLRKDRDDLLEWLREMDGALTERIAETQVLRDEKVKLATENAKLHAERVRSKDVVPKEVEHPNGPPDPVPDPRERVKVLEAVNYTENRASKK